MEIEHQQFFQLLADNTRLRALVLIRHAGQLCVCDLVDALGIIQPKVSRHLAILRDGGVVSDRRAGQWIYYSLNPDLPAWASEVIDTTLREAATREPFASDLAALSRLPGDRGSTRCA